jgi:hypothetical protein
MSDLKVRPPVATLGLKRIDGDYFMSEPFEAHGKLKLRPPEEATLSAARKNGPPRLKPEGEARGTRPSSVRMN